MVFLTALPKNHRKSLNDNALVSLSCIAPQGRGALPASRGRDAVPILVSHGVLAVLVLCASQERDALLIARLLLFGKEHRLGKSELE